MHHQLTGLQYNVYATKQDELRCRRPFYKLEVSPQAPTKPMNISAHVTLIPFGVSRTLCSPSYFKNKLSTFTFKYAVPSPKILPISLANSSMQRDT